MVLFFLYALVIGLLSIACVISVLGVFCIAAAIFIYIARPSRRGEHTALMRRGLFLFVYAVVPLSVGLILLVFLLQLFQNPM